MPGTGVSGLFTRYVARHRGRLTVALGCAVAATALAAVVPLINQHIVDRLTTSPDGSVLALVAALVSVGVAKFAADAARQYAGARIALDVQHSLRTDLVRAAHRLDPVALRRTGSGTILESSTRDVGVVEGMLDPLPNAAGGIAQLLISVGLMVWLSPLLTAVTLLLVPAAVISVRRARHRLLRAGSAAQQHAARLTGMVTERIAGIEVVKGHAQEDREARRVEGVANTITSHRLRVVRLTSSYLAFMTLVPLSGQVLTFGVGAVLAVRGAISVGTLVAFLGYVTLLVGAARTVAGLSGYAFDGRAAIARATGLAAARPSLTDGTRTVPSAPYAGQGISIELCDVTFAHDPDRPVLDGVRLAVAPGELVVLTGGLGAGKTTLLDLVVRKYPPDRGAVRVGGVDVSELAAESLRGTVTMVGPEAALFAGTVSDNIGAGRDDATFADVVSAATAVCADGFIATLPQGYGTPVGEAGVTLSGGQRQRIALARAVLRRPAALLFDDAASAVDDETADRIDHLLVHGMPGVTRIVVSGRMTALAAAADQVVLLVDGRIAEHGTHEDLLVRSAGYRALAPAGTERGA